MRMRTLALLTLIAFFAISPVMVLDVSAQDVDGAQEGTRNDGFDWGWLGLLGLLGLIPRAPVDEHVDTTRTSNR